MTTIAYRIAGEDLQIASDTQTTFEGGWGKTFGRKITFPKLSGAKIVLALAGDDEVRVNLLKWLATQKVSSGWLTLQVKGHPFEEDSERHDFHAVLFGRNGALHVFQKHFDWIKEPRCALGTGSEFALGAMDFGADPQQAVNAVIANHRDPYTGGQADAYVIPLADLSEIKLDHPEEELKLVKKYRKED